MQVLICSGAYARAARAVETPLLFKLETCGCSILGLMLFTIFIGDLPNASEGKVTTALYADDTKIFNCIGSDEDWIALQTTLSNMEH